MLIQNALFNHTALPVLGKSLDAATLRDRAISANVANVNTPGYQRVEVAFEAALRQALNPKPVNSGSAAKDGEKLDRLNITPDLSHVEAVAYRPMDEAQASGVNNVDIDMEMSKLAENQIAFNFGVRFVQSERGLIESAIKGRAG
jgi:flagellar basal-body rod protein FlgB